MPAAARTTRAAARAGLTRAILDRASAHLAEAGPAALSLRAVARDLGLASSAVYRYFPSRDALLTALLVEAYDDLGSALEDADAGVRRGDLRGRFRAVAHALRTWALAEPHRYALVHGSPVPGHAASDDAVTSAQQAMLALLILLGDAQQAGRRPPRPERVPAAEKAALAPVVALVDPPLSPAYAVRGTTAWATLLGQVSLELSGHQRGGVLDHETHFATVVDLLAGDLGLT